MSANTLYQTITSLIQSKKKILIVIIAIMLLSSITSFGKSTNFALKGKDPKSNFYFEFLMGYAIPINASYIDTYKNDDIYWNPNSGINLDIRFKFKFTDYIYLALPVDLVIGIYQYKTTDGRKVNTEAQAGNTPVTTNTEWSVAPNLVPTLIVKPHPHPAVPYIGFGLGLGVLWSFESWEFANNDGDNAKLVIAKYYYPTALFKGEMGWDIPIAKRAYFRIAAVFSLANYIMYRVELTNYYVNGNDTIGEYDEKSTVYSYAFNAPDENKGGDCLLAGFTYQNYPQQKISTNVAVKIGFSFNF